MRTYSQTRARWYDFLKIQLLCSSSELNIPGIRQWLRLADGDRDVAPGLFVPIFVLVGPQSPYGGNNGESENRFYFFGMIECPKRQSVTFN